MYGNVVLNYVAMPVIDGCARYMPETKACGKVDNRVQNNNSVIIHP